MPSLLIQGYCMTYFGLFGSHRATYVDYCRASTLASIYIFGACLQFVF
jgi:hypothetical protein